MKKILFSLPVCLLLAVSTPRANAQVSISVGIWTPPPEYASVDYYYLPDVEAYYYVPTHRYIYLDGGNWVWRSYLPPRYASYSIATGYKVAVDRPRPYRYFYHDRRMYAHYRGRPGGVIVRDHYRTRYVGRPYHAGRPYYAGGPHGFGHGRPGPVYHNIQRPHGGPHGGPGGFHGGPHGGGHGPGGHGPHGHH
ncbi:hypothetical protein [Mucilaginibacter sp. L3T2-6]|uniref:hypothetical protein n=1 Tax=Mucilaginibacter sp. L3T2-6 TaxID=3062491 RepID=UPI002675E9F1|nr:hypothetical protein [Mucilaginibacter sp. L3T2-6]MDO3641107.1 hypothetical protein [Mucilaginibacter sp. L3T2-6]MDV6213417.1 hypothetical protein [Mucilaginibacter sp. L3T2-6]